jgi:cell division protein FtsB
MNRNCAILLLPLWLGVVVYTILSFVAGTKGLSAYTQMEDELTRLETNLESLKRVNGDLAGSMNALLYDQDTITAYARELGYGKKGEQFVRIVGITASPERTFYEGSILHSVVPHTLSNEIIRNIALGATLALFFSLLLGETLRRNSLSHNEYAIPETPAGIPLKYPG